MADQGPTRSAAFSTADVDLATEGGRAFLQERLGLFGKVGFLISLAFYLLGALALALTGPVAIAWRYSIHGANLLHLATTAGLGLMWFVCGRAQAFPVPTLRVFDVAATFIVTASPAVTQLVWGHDLPGHHFIMLLIVTNVSVARAVFVPSRPGRTCRLTLVSVVPTVLAASAVEASVRVAGGYAPFPIVAVLWSLCAVAIATVTSQVIYGLRQQVREASQLGQYTLEEKLGEGGMGAVYRARHALLRRPTAIKLLPLGKAGEANVKRFEREVQLTAELSHPNTVSIFDYGRTPDGVFYYAMEYLEGLDLETLVRADGAQLPARALHVLKQVAGALAEAHDRGLIHRDVKPANIILCERGGVADVAKVVDFGLVKSIEGTPSDPGLTRVDAIAGTPLYISPEALTAPETVDGRSDLYGLGAVGYFLVTGQTVFEGRTVVEIASHHLHTKPTPPSERLGSPLPPRLEAVILACLEKDKERRPRNAHGLLQTLAACDDVGVWREDEARGWWETRGREIRAERSARLSGAGKVSSLPALSVVLEGRRG
jgi:eukaryotic-like serine/threonine-protein kinase